MTFMFATYGDDSKVALYGAGAHTPWLLGILGDMGRISNVTTILDDNRQGEQLCGIPVSQPGNSVLVDIVVPSSDVYEHAMTCSARERFGDSVVVFPLYDEIGLGPYPKESISR